MRKKLLFVLFLGLCVLFATQSFANSKVLALGTAQQTQESIAKKVIAYGDDTLYADGIITDFDSTVTLDQKGNALITEKIIVFFPNQRHGIYRFIPNEVILDTGKRLKQPITIKEVRYQRLASATGTLGTGPQYSYTPSTTTGNYTLLKIGSADTYILGAYEYTIEYSMKRAVRFQDGYQELYLNITGDKWEIPIMSASATIKSPASATDTRCFTGSAGSTTVNCTLTNLDKTYFAKTTTPDTTLARGLTIALKFSDNAFTPPTAQEKLLALIKPLLPLLIPTVVLIFGFLTWQRHGKDTPLFAIPPIFVPTEQMEKESLSIQNSLLAMKSLPVSTTAELIRLAEKGYLKLSYEKSKISIDLSPEQQVSLPEFLSKQPASLQTMLETLTRNYSASSYINSLTNVHSKIATATKQAAGEFKNTPYITDKSEGLRDTFSVSAILALVGGFVLFGVMSESLEQYWALWPISLLISGAFFAVFAAGMLKRTREGQQLYLDLHGMKKYIKAAEVKRLEFFNDPKKMIAHFEQILPYAIILKLDKQWTKEFGPILEQLNYEPTWMVSDIPLHTALPRTYAAMTSQLSSSMAKISTPPQSSGSSFGGGGGGGFSGGGSGGGGGGSW